MIIVITTRKHRCLIRTKSGLPYPSGALITLGFWAFFAKSHTYIFRKESLCRYILNTYINHNSRTWAPQDLIKYVMRQITTLCKTYGFSKQNGYWVRPLTLAIDPLYQHAFAIAEQYELEYRTIFDDIPLVKHPFPQLFQTSQRYVHDYHVVPYFEIPILK